MRTRYTRTLLLIILSLFSISAISDNIGIDYSKTYYIHNKETDKYLGFQTGTYTENYKINATPLDAGTIPFTIVYDEANDVYNISYNGKYLIQSSTLGWNTGQSTTSYDWIIEASDTEGYYYIKKNSSNWLNAQSNNGYAYTDGGGTWSNCRWEFVPAQGDIADGTYIIHNKESETNHYLGWETETYTENNSRNATPLEVYENTEYTITYEWKTKTYNMSVNGTYLSQSSSYGWNTSQSTTSYSWTIEPSDIDGFYYILNKNSKYLKAEEDDGYAYTNGTSGNNVHWEFLKPNPANKVLSFASATLGDNLFDLDGNTVISVSDTENMTIKDVLDNYETFTEEQQKNAISSLSDAINDPMSYHMPNGRYLIRNRKYSEGYDDTFLSSMGSPIGIVEDALTYWSIWDVTNNGDGTFTIVNEGNKNVLSPTKTLDNANPRDDGYLCYDTSKRFFYRIGSTNSTSTVTFKFIPGCLLFDASKHGSAAIQPTSLPTNSDGKYTYLYMDLENGDGVDRRNDHVAKSEAISVVSTQVLWNLYEIKSNKYTDELGTHEGETEMFSRLIDELSGHVGGVVSLENVSDIPCLNAINVAVTYAKSQITTGTNGSEYYKEILEQINTIKNDPELKVYYQDLKSESVNGTDTIFHPFFIENLCGSRPTYGAKLCQYSWGTNPNYSIGGTWHFGWLTNYPDSVNMDGMFYVTKSENKVTYHYIEDGVDKTTSDYYYVMKNGNGWYLKMYDSTIGSTDNIKCQVDVTQDVDSAMHFVITPIIPGIWLIQDIQMAHTGNVNTINETDNVYLTITKAAENTTQPFYGLTHYSILETSSLWRFITSNELDPMDIYNLDTSGKTTTPKPLYATYSFSMNTMVSKTALNKKGENTHLKAYRCSYAWKNASDGRLRVDFVSLPTYIDKVLNEECYYFEANKGYMIAGYSDVDTITCTTSFVSSSAEIPDSCKLAPEMNLLEGVSKDILIDTNNWYQIFALAYNSPDSIIGSYYGAKVKGVGIGFYQLKVGSVLPAQSAYLPVSVFMDAVSNGIDVYDIDTLAYTTNVKGTIPVEISFEDTEEETTFVVETELPVFFKDKMFDLQGRPLVKKPESGVYICNGKKILISR